MSWARDERRRNLQKPVPGCMGRMIDIFDLGNDMGGTKLLADRAHRDGSLVSRNRSDVVKKASGLVGIHVEDRPIANGAKKSSSSKRAGGTPIKMLIAQEMSIETNSKQKPPSLVARLMGLDDAMPAQYHTMTAKKSLPEVYPRSKSAGSFRRNQEQEDAYNDMSRSHEIHSCSHEKEFNDVSQIWQQPSRTSRNRDQPPLKGRGIENPNEKRMALVRQKFVEAKRLATDEKLLHSKEFQDTLEVLSSNRDLFLKFLEEPNFLFSKHTEDLNAITPNPQTKRITVLKPSKVVGLKAEKHVKNQQDQLSSGSEWETDSLHDSSTVSLGKVKKVSQPTRIVVLKPSPAKTHNNKANAAPISSSELPQPSDYHREFQAGEAMGSREIAKEITRQMQENVNRHRRDESLLSSVLSNGYVGDDSSFHKSETESVGDIIGNFSDSEILTPTSQNSWDYNHRMGSPYSLSSFSRPSYSPESSVIREAKKRISERWDMVATNAMSQEQTHAQHSSTLEEVLAISNVKKNGGNGVVTVLSSSACGEEEDLRAPADCISISQMKDRDDWESFPRTLSRSRSLPVSSSCYENIGSPVEISDSQISKSVVPKEAKKSKSGKPSLKGIVSSFFSKSKKSVRQKIVSPHLVATDDRFQPGSTESVCTRTDDLPQLVYKSCPDGNTIVNLEEEYGKPPSSTSGKDGAMQRNSSCKVITLEKPNVSENLNKNIHKRGVPAVFSEYQDQPSPTSVLDIPFVDDVQVPLPSENADAGCRKKLSRSAPIESVARSLSWDDTHIGISLPNPSRLPQADDEEHELVMSVQSLLSYAGFGNEKVNTVFTRWHSLEIPLDEMLLARLLDMKQEQGKCRERRSSHRFLFDCVNAALLDIGKAAISSSYPYARTHAEAWKISQPGAPISEEVCRLLRDWFYCERQNHVFGDMDNGSLAVDRLLRKEVMGRGWTELVRTEMDDISKDIGGEVLEDLIVEALLDIIGEFS